jgi:hypothetical protein
MIVDSCSLYLSSSGVHFADIFHSVNLTNPNLSAPLFLIFDLSYSDSSEVSHMRSLPGPLTPQLASQLSLYREAPEGFKTYFVERYTNGTICAVNQ